MDTVVLTTALSNNYGAALQTYAMVKAINKTGAEAVVYRYNNPNRINNSMTIKQRIIHNIWNVVTVAIGRKKKQKKFEEFRNEYIPLTEQLFQSSEELMRNYGNYDVYIAGSDQIWNPDFFIDDLSYFLDFLPEEKKRISYASSFGKSEFKSEKYRDKCAMLLSRFQHISVREQSGMKIAKSLCGIDAEWVLDPTLLLNKYDWMKLADTDILTDEIILCYTMPGDRVVTESIEKIAKQLQLITGLPVVRIGNKEYDVFKYGRKSCDIEAGPLEFVRYFLKAKYVVTNSFHGTAFSLNLDKDFIIPINDSLKTSTALHERILSILKLLGAESAVIKTSELDKTIDFSKHAIQHGKISDKLEEERKRSFEYLKLAIGD